jgi:hypothetical protein
MARVAGNVRNRASLILRLPLRKARRLVPPHIREQHAVVLGAGMAGLLAARVLSEFYVAIAIVERDELAEVPVLRKGIPQGRHVHAFTSGGSHGLGRLFPGLLDELVDAGANVCRPSLSRRDLAYAILNCHTRTVRQTGSGSVSRCRELRTG